jgi:hypothetical protein
LVDANNLDTKFEDHNNKAGNYDAILEGYFKLCFIITKVGYLDANLGGYFEYFFIMIDVDNLDKNIRDYFELSFVMTEVGNLYAKLGVTLCIFHNNNGG